MKQFLFLILFSGLVFAQATYDVGQGNANTAQALAASLANLDTIIIFRNELNSLSSGKQNLDADLTDLSDGELTGSKVGSGISGTNITTGTVADARIAATIARLASPTFTGTVIIPTPFTLGAVSVLPTGTELNFVDGVTSSIQVQLDAKQSTAGMSAYSDTVRIAVWGMKDSVDTGDFVAIKMENNYTVTEVAAYTNTGTVTFNIEERGETTPNTSGTDVMTSDLVADSDQQETGTFSNATLDRDDWLMLNVTSITGDPTTFGVTVRGIKTN